MSSLLDNVQVLDAGERIVLASAEEQLIEQVIATLELEGAVSIQKPVKVGSQWIASFFNPNFKGTA